ncbi:muconolactone Delta-isomerase family protein [Phaeodactylibacter xiamenensis]|uniref:muconolactone Delta-isomerase family protein n=1 Tax=Phaeodactylibacter xiamenensis TaxID=1524460 RepID=UPI0024A84AAC|nr:muconolactone Delta-isomerase family protein [Phaeodactylibacter xiamenensis]
MINPTSQFMVDFTLPEELSTEFTDLIPYQRAVVDRYLSEGSLVNYALALESAKLWAIFNANSEMEVLEMLSDFPLTPFMQVEINQLTSFNTAEATPAFSLN